MKQFDFGKNWQAFSEQRIDSERLAVACQSLTKLLQKDGLAGLTFLDVGCGSGLFAIAAHKLGAAKVVGLDINPRCLETSERNRDRLIPGAPVEFYTASALEPDQLRRFGAFDVVYAWGSLHHTGSMWTAVRNVAQCVAPGGLFVLAIYNKHVSSPIWRAIKWTYNQVPGPVQRLMVYLFGGVIYVAKWLVTRSHPLKKERGMDFWFDVVDWVGGHPYEYAEPAEVEQRLHSNGFKLRRYVASQVPTGCNEFVFLNSKSDPP
jgi:2-polyprenyl-3-methyl-5-hydroxy-6-metoxy-1,4-benzoquinol methylase